jgi:hypothetical protein
VNGIGHAIRQPDRPTAIILVAAALAIGLPAFRWSQAVAQDVDYGAISREYTIKGAFVYNFGRYVQWPPEAFQNAQAPFVVGVLGPSQITPSLQRIAKAKKIQDRPIQIRQFSDVDATRACHILFFPADVEPKLRAQAVERCSGRPVLLVGEGDDFLDQGGMIDLVIQENKVRVYIALKAAKRQGLTISSKLLQIAQVVD